MERVQNMEIRELDGLQVTVTVDNYYDALLPDPPSGKRFRTSLGNSIYGEHGLSFFITSFRDGKKYHFFFDFGVDGDLLLHNLRVLKIDGKSGCAFVLSHGHFDHYGGLRGFAKHLYLLGVRGVPLYVGKGYFAKRFSKRPDEAELTDLGELKKEDLEGATRIYEVDEPMEFLPGCYLVPNIQMVTNYEELSDNLLVEREGVVTKDDFREELALFFAVKDRGIVIISGCAHRGIVNTLFSVLRLTKEKKIHAVIGGFHLVFADKKRILKTISDFEKFSPDFIVPCHCTGFYARSLFMERLGSRCILNAVGTTYNFGII